MIGMFARVHLRTSTTTDITTTVPQSAVLDIEGHSVVFVHTAPEVFVRKEVVCGARSDGRVAVRGDIHPGDRVVIQGVLSVQNARAR
jgi:hypothetical protein